MSSPRLILTRLCAAALAPVVLAASCGTGGSLSAWCGLVAEGAVVPLDASVAVVRWRALEAAAPADLRDDVERLRVAAEQVAGLGVADDDEAARLVLTPRVIDAHAEVVDAAAERCRIDPDTLQVIDSR